MEDAASTCSTFSTAKLRRGLELDDDDLPERKPTPFLNNNHQQPQQSTSTPIADVGSAR